MTDYTQDRQILRIHLRRSYMAGGLSLLVTANFSGVQYILEHGSVRAAEAYSDGAYTGKYKLMNKTRLLWKSRFVYTEEKHRKLADGSVALAGKMPIKDLACQ